MLPSDVVIRYLHWPRIEIAFNSMELYIDGLHLTSWQTCWKNNTKEYFIIAIVGASQRGRALVERNVIMDLVERTRVLQFIMFDSCSFYA